MRWCGNRVCLTTPDPVAVQCHCKQATTNSGAGDRAKWSQVPYWHLALAGGRQGVLTLHLCSGQPRTCPG